MGDWITDMSLEEMEKQVKDRDLNDIYDGETNEFIKKILLNTYLSLGFCRADFKNEGYPT